jgi:sugar (pentulose or hexulose) kinase
MYLGIDLGTSACRVCVLDAGERVRHSARADLPPDERTAGCHSQQPQDWWDALAAAVHTLPAALRADIRAVLIAGTSATVLACDAALEPLAPALMYDDVRASAEAAALRDALPAGGAAQGASSALAKALHLAVRLPLAARVCSQAGWMAGRLLGHAAAEDENNALKWGYDPLARAWPAAVQALWPVRLGALPPVCPPGTNLGLIAASSARALGLPDDVRVLAGTTDSTAAFVAAGASDPGDAVSSLGSTLVLKQLVPQPITAAEYGVYSHRLGSAWIAGGASNAGGAALARYFTPAQLQALSARLDPGRDSPLDYYPLPTAGERFPCADPQLAPRLSPRPADDVAFLHGLLQGLARIEAQGYARLHALGAPPLRRVLSSGGGATNPAYTALRARLLGVPVLPARHTEAATGAALLAQRSAAT